MNDLAEITSRIPTMSAQAVDKVRRLEREMRALPAALHVRIPTDHVLHGGMYARTICIPAGVVLTGALIRVPTMLVFDGHVTVNTGDGESILLEGYRVLAASAHRRQAITAHRDTHMTMMFATRAKTVAEAEDEFTEEVHLLASREPDAVNNVISTGE